MTSGNFEKFEEKLEREKYIESIIREYYAKKNAEVEKSMKLEVSKWKNIEKKQKEINFKATGFRETNRERKEREEKKQKEINFKATGFRETNRESKAREATVRKNKLLKRSKHIDNTLRKKEGVFCIFCKTRADKNGLCYC